MKKVIILCLLSTLLIGCKTNSRRIDASGNGIDWDEVNANSTNTHVTYAQGEGSCYSDGSWSSNAQFDYWVEKYEKRRN